MFFQTFNWTRFRPQIIAVSIKNLLLFDYGLTLGILSIIIPSVQDANNENEPLYLSNEQISWISSLNFVNVPIGCLFSGYITEKIGRKLPMQFINIPMLICWLLYWYSNQVEHIYIAQSVIGLCGGLLEAPVYSYVGEISEKNLRGFMSATALLSAIFGSFTAIFLGYILNWRKVALSCAIVPILTFLIFYIVPESPHWLLCKGRIKKAQENLAWLRGTKNVDDIIMEFKEIESNLIIQKSKKNIIQQYWSKEFLRPFMLIITTFFISNFCGSLPLHIHAVSIFETFNSPMNGHLANVILNVADVISVILFLFSISRLGRRLLTIIPTLVYGLCLIPIAYYGYINRITKLQTKSNISQISWSPTIFLLVGSFFANIGIKLVPWVLIGEIFNIETRSVATGISCGIYYVFSFFINNYFLNMIELLTLWGLLFVFAFISILGAIILHFLMPETEGKSLKEIEMHFSGIQKLDNKVNNC